MHEQSIKHDVPLKGIDANSSASRDLQRLYDDRGNKWSRDQLHDKYIHDSRYIWERLFDDTERDIFYPNGDKLNASKLSDEPQLTVEPGDGLDE
ncbi:hypothetical protein ACFL0R_04890 [Pseudomonadota bacterium]